MKRFVSALISLGILAALYTKLDIHSSLTLLKQSDLPTLGLSILFIVPLFFLLTFRLIWITPPHCKITYKEYFRLVLLGNILNMVLPAKLGDISKAYFMKKDHNMKGSTALSIILVEKVGDMIGLGIICIVGLIAYGKTDPSFLSFIISISAMILVGLIALLSRKLCHSGYCLLALCLPEKISKKIRPLFLAWTATQRFLSIYPSVILKLLSMSVFISFIHFFGLWLMFKSIAPDLSLLLHFALTPISVLAGLVPLTFSGIGIRDAALVALFTRYVGAEMAAAFGLLFTIRLLLLALPGLPFIGLYFSKKKDIK
jgi:glycosyltransferase 2 family protein